MKTIDVLIHVNETIEETARFRLEEPLRDAEGMVTPSFSPQHHHLKFVAYDSDYTSVAAVLGQIAGVADSWRTTAMWKSAEFTLPARSSPSPCFMRESGSRS